MDTTAATVAADAERTPEALVGRLFEATIGMMDVMSVYLGDRLGLYRALRDDGPATAGDLARRAGIDERYAREWLEQQAATGILDVDDVAAASDRRRYELPKAFVDPLLNPDSPYSIAPFARSVVASAKVLPQLLEAYRSGGGVEWSAYGPDMIEAQGDLNRPWLVNSFGTELLPAIPAIHERLVADPPARVADVACGVGWAAIAIAGAYPKRSSDIRRPRCGRPRGGRPVRPGRGHRGHPRPVTSGRGPDGRETDAPARRRGAHRGRKDGGLVHCPSRR
jgi:hypothetical protein